MLEISSASSSGRTSLIFSAMALAVLIYSNITRVIREKTAITTL